MNREELKVNKRRHCESLKAARQSHGLLRRSSDLLVMTNDKGFTLVELMMVTAILPVIFIALFTVTDLANKIFQTNQVYSRLNTDAMQTLRYISREVGESSPLSNPSHITITTDGNNNSVLTFQIPVDHDGDGDAVTAGLNPDNEWGVYHEAGNQTAATLNGWARYSINNNNQLIREALDSNLVAIANTERIVSNNVQLFSVTRAVDTVTMALTLTATDTVANQGGHAQSWTFTSVTNLRNAVS